MAEKSHGSDDTFSEKMSQMSHLADATIRLDDGSTFKVFRLLLAVGSEVRSVTFCLHFESHVALHLELRSVTCNGAEENQAHRYDPYDARVQEQPSFLVCSSINIFTSMGLQHHYSPIFSNR